MFVAVNDSGRLTALVFDEKYATGMTEVAEPEGFDSTRPLDYVLRDGEVVHDPLPPTEEEIEAERAAMIDNQAKVAAVMFVRSQASVIDDEQAASVGLLFEDWAAGVDYKKDDVRRYDNKLWRCAQDHKSQVSWKPKSAPSLWYEISYGEDGILVWKMPVGGHDAPNKNDKRHYPNSDSPVYISKRDGNTSIPGADEWWEKLT